MDLGLIAQAAVAFAIGWNAMTFAKALVRCEPLWPSGILLAVLIPLFIALMVQAS